MEIINKILALVPERFHQVGHFIAGFAITCGLQYFMNYWFAFGAVIVIAVLKEVYDKYNGGIFDPIDVGLTVQGGILGIVTVAFFHSNPIVWFSVHTFWDIFK